MIKHFYINSPLTAGGILPVPDTLRHRLTGVLRLSEGDEVGVFNGQHGLWAARLSDGKAKRLEVLHQIAPQPAQPSLTLVLGLPKREAWESALRQATELGVGHIQPLATRYAQRDKINAERAQTLLIEAAEQCERLTVPTLHPVQSLESWLEGLQTPCAWAYERLLRQGYADQGLPSQGAANPQAVLIGPEGGFSPEEVAALQGHKHIHPFSLGPTILRTDTAVVAGLVRMGFPPSRE